MLSEEELASSAVTTTATLTCARPPRRSRVAQTSRTRVREFQGLMRVPWGSAEGREPPISSARGIRLRIILSAGGFPSGPVIETRWRIQRSLAVPTGNWREPAGHRYRGGTLAARCRPLRQPQRLNLNHCSLVRPLGSSELAFGPRQCRGDIGEQPRRGRFWLRLSPGDRWW